MTHPKNLTQKKPNHQPAKPCARSQPQSGRRNRVSRCGKGESSILSDRMADDQGSSKPWRSNTSKLHEGSLNGVPVCLALAEKATVAGKSEIRRWHESANQASRILWEECSNASHTDRGRHCAPERNREDTEHGNMENPMQNLDLSFLSINERGNIIPKTPEAALVAA
jgi:hypothetical protein